MKFSLSTLNPFGPNLKKEVADLVERARLGDQNAMAMIQCVAESAKDPSNLKARNSFKCIQKYVRENPNKEVSDIGSDFICQRVALANGPLIAGSTVVGIGADIGAEAIGANDLFVTAYANFGNHEAIEHLANSVGAAAVYVRTGAALAYARALQAVRMGAKISALDPEAGWELGEKL